MTNPKHFLFQFLCPNCCHLLSFFLFHLHTDQVHLPAYLHLTLVACCLPTLLGIFR